VVGPSPVVRAPSARLGPVARAGRGYRVAVTSGRWVVLTAWVLAAALVTALVPPSGGGGDTFGDLLPPESEVLQVQQRVLEEFRVPVLSGTTVVVHQPGGLSLLTRADSVLWALATTQDVLESPEPPPAGTIRAAIPVPTGRADTTVTYLYMSEGTGLRNTVRLADAYAAHFNNQPAVTSYVTGFVPAQVAQIGYLASRIGLFEIASVLLILLIVALAFRSLLAPLVVLGIAGVGYLVYFPLLGRLAALFGFEVPSQLEPVLLALLLGVVTDYCVLFFSAFRDELDADADHVTSARQALRTTAPVVAVAGLTVAGGTIALLAAPFAIFRGLGPALALTVVIGLAVCLTLTPAVMTIAGWRLFTVLPVRGSARKGPLVDVTPQRTGRLTRLITLLTRRGPALAAAVGVVLVLGLASVPLAAARLDLSFTAGLPGDDSVSEGAQLLDDAGLRGISAPTEVLLEQPGVVGQQEALRRLETAIAGQPGVARVLGPSDAPTAEARGLVLAESGNAARFVIIYDSDPLAAEAIDHVRSLQQTLPRLARDAGLPDAEVALTGQTLIASEVAELTRESLQVTLLVAMSVELVILALYLRALLAPVALLACSLLSVAAALGLTTLLFQDVLGEQGLTFYAPFASAVLLIALGSDYNVFSVGSIWEEARRRPLRAAMVVAVPRASHAITTAGAILAATFALVAIIPLSTFRQIAFAMAVGLLIDTLVIRPVLTPAVLTLLGRVGTWPARRMVRDVGPPPPPPQEVPGDRASTAD
jgi:RND superfamily putative drug exporter